MGVDQAVIQGMNTDQFRQHIRDLIQTGSINSRIVRHSRHGHVYNCGDPDSSVYYVEKGRIKLLSPSPDGKECLVAIYSAGDLFGELSLCGKTTRPDTAVAMNDSILRQIPAVELLGALRREPKNLGLLLYLITRLAEQQQVISSLLTVNSEQRLALTLQRLARNLGKKDPRSVRIDQKLSQEELAAMVGTTRTRIGIFLKKFRSLGLIELSADRYLVVKDQKLTEYIEGLALSEGRTEVGRVPDLAISRLSGFPTPGASGLQAVKPM